MSEMKVRWFRAVRPNERHLSEAACVSRKFGRRANRARRTTLTAVVVTLVVILRAPIAWAQDEPPKVEPPVAAPTAPADASKSEGPATQDAQKKDSAPSETQKNAPLEPAPAEPQNDATGQPAEKQKDAPPAPSEATKEKSDKAVAEDIEGLVDAAQALSSRYKFVEKYGIEDAPDRADRIGQYQVGVRRTVKSSREKAQARPERTEWSRVCIYTERAAKVSRLGEPTDLLRRYDRVILRHQTPTPPLNPPFLQGLTVWYRLATATSRPLVLTLSDRPLREGEYAVIVEGEMSIPQLVAFFPNTPKRVSETWAISPAAYERVAGKLADSSEFEMTGSLISVTKASTGSSLVAKIDVSGHFNVGANPSAFHAQIDFSFEPIGISLPARGAAGTDKVVVATGRITQVLASHKATTELPEAAGRAKGVVIHEVVLQRRPIPTVAAAGETPIAPLEIPDPAPVANKENSWVVFDDPAGRFHFRHPQELIVNQAAMADAYVVPLEDNLTNPTWRVALHFPTSRGDTPKDEPFRDIAHFQAGMEKQFAKAKDLMTWGTAGVLDGEDWKALNRKVYRSEVAFRSKEGDRAIYADFYLAMELTGMKRFSLESWTERPDHVECRKQAEDIIRTVQFGPFDKRVQSARPNPRLRPRGEIRRNRPRLASILGRRLLRRRQSLVCCPSDFGRIGKSHVSSPQGVIVCCFAA